VEKLGTDGIAVGRNLTTDQAVALARYADEIAALPPEERNQLGSSGEFVGSYF
jgi:hypothetical protein